MSKQKINRKWMILLSLLLIGAGLALRAYISEELPAPVQKLAIISGATRHQFTVEVARTKAEMAQGLMYREHMDADNGMVFIYPEPVETAMWMKNTHIPLDMLFINTEKVITHIHENARPFDETPIESGGVIAMTLEINGGEVAKRGIKEGDRVEFNLP